MDSSTHLHSFGIIWICPSHLDTFRLVLTHWLVKDYYFIIFGYLTLRKNSSRDENPKIPEIISSQPYNHPLLRFFISFRYPDSRYRNQIALLKPEGKIGLEESDYQNLITGRLPGLTNYSKKPELLRPR